MRTIRQQYLIAQLLSCTVDSIGFYGKDYYSVHVTCVTGNITNHTQLNTLIITKYGLLCSIFMHYIMNNDNGVIILNNIQAIL